MSIQSTMADKPNREDVKEGSFALCIRDEGHAVWQYNTKSPFRSAPEWREVDQYSHQNAPRMNLKGATIIRDEDGEVWVYADEVDPEREVAENPNGTIMVEQTNQGAYAVEFSDSQVINGNTQAEVMSDAVDYLIGEYNLLNKVSLPYMSGHKNAIINSRKSHPDGREMRQPKRVSSGDYVETSMGRQQKEEYLSDLCSECGDISIEFTDGWNSL